MDTCLTRRSFLAAAMASTALPVLARGAGEAAAAPAPKLSKALILDRPNPEQLAKLRDAGFDGVETVSSGRVDLAAFLPEAEKSRAAAEKLGMRIHSVLRGWAEFNDPAKAAESFAVTEDSLEVARAYGADAVLLVPCRVGGMKMPRPWEFHLDFDPATGHIRRLVKGDGAPYADYVKAHDRAEDATREWVQKLIPRAEKTGVVIALENVWNNLWVRPAIFRNLVESFRSPWVKAYFDIGNHVKYAAPEEWILELGSLLAKLHVKDFRLNPSDARGEGDFVNIRDGSVRWPVVRAALEVVGYGGWLTIEGGDLSVEEHSKRLDLIIAGK